MAVVALAVGEAVDLVDEQDRGCRLPSVLESLEHGPLHVAQMALRLPAGSGADDEVRAAGVRERLREDRLAHSRRPGQEEAPVDVAPGDAAVLPVLQVLLQLQSPLAGLAVAAHGFEAKLDVVFESSSRRRLAGVARRFRTHDELGQHAADASSRTYDGPLHLLVE